MNGVGVTGAGYTGIGVTGQDVLIYGNLLVTGGIDPTYLALTPQSSNPLPSSLDGMWIETGGSLRVQKMRMDDFSGATAGYIDLEPTRNPQLTLSDGITPTEINVVTLNNNAILLNDFSGTGTTNTITPTGLAVVGDANGAVSVTVGDPLTTGSANAGFSAVTATSSTLSLSAGAISTAPFFVPPTGTASLTTSTTNARLDFSYTGQFTNGKTLLLDLDQLTHNTSDGSGDFSISTNGDLLMTADNFDLSATRMIMPSLASTNYLDYNAGKVSIINNSVGGTANPLLVLQNNNNTAGSVAIETYKNKVNGATNDTIANWSMYAKDYTGAKTEFARINSTITNSSAISGNDGALNIWAAVNGTISNVFTFNGADNENNSFRPLDLTGNALKTSSGSMTIETTGSSGTGTITIAPKTGASILIPSQVDPTNDFIRINPQTSANSQQLLMTATDTGTGFSNSINLLNLQYRPFVELKADFGGAINKSIQIDADGAGSSNNKITAYDGQTNLPFQIDTSGYTNGSIELKVNDTSGDLLLTGTNLQSTSSSGSSGQYLRIKLNGTYYKIFLESD
jgi:hypothetical protein